MVEYNVGRPVGIVEYKHFSAPKPNIKHATYRALSELASASYLPFLLAFHWPGIWAFCVFPVNEYAKLHYAEWERMTEREYVSRLYRPACRA